MLAKLGPHLLGFARLRLFLQINPDLPTDSEVDVPNQPLPTPLIAP